MCSPSSRTDSKIQDLSQSISSSKQRLFINKPWDTSHKSDFLNIGHKVRRYSLNIPDFIEEIVTWTSHILATSLSWSVYFLGLSTSFTWKLWYSGTATSVILHFLVVCLFFCMFVRVFRLSECCNHTMS